MVITGGKDSGQIGNRLMATMGGAFKTQQSRGMIVESDCAVFAEQPIDDVRPQPRLPQVPNPDSSSKKIQPVR
jgi:hypothetical protein